MLTFYLSSKRCQQRTAAHHLTRAEVNEVLMRPACCRPDDPRYDDKLQKSIARLVAGISMQTLCVLAKGSCPKDKCNTDSMQRFASVVDCNVYKATWTGWLRNIHLTESQVRAVTATCTFNMICNHSPA
jgi:hypothetical protein